MNKNWHDRIEAAEARGYFTKEEKDLAEDWFSCACGELDVRIPRGYRGEPLDGQLNLYGIRFARCVKDDNFSEARSTLAQIEAREMELIADIERQKK